MSTKLFAEALEPIPLLPARYRQTKSPATDDERSLAETVLGGVGWLSRQLRSDVAFGYSWSAQIKNEATIADLLEINKLVDYCHETADTDLVFRGDVLQDPQDVRLAVFADSYLNNVDARRSAR